MASPSTLSCVVLRWARRPVHGVADCADDRRHCGDCVCDRPSLRRSDEVRAPCVRSSDELIERYSIIAMSEQRAVPMGCAQGAGVPEREPVPYVPAVRQLPPLVPERDVQLRDDGARLRLPRHRLLRRVHLALGCARLTPALAPAPYPLTARLASAPCLMTRGSLLTFRLASSVYVPVLVLRQNAKYRYCKLVTMYE